MPPLRLHSRQRPQASQAMRCFHFLRLMLEMVLVLLLLPNGAPHCSALLPQLVGHSQQQTLVWRQLMQWQLPCSLACWPHE